MVIPSSVADPHQVDEEPDSDPSFHFDADPDPTFHSDTDPDPTFQFDPDPDPTTYFSPDLDPPMLQWDYVTSVLKSSSCNILFCFHTGGHKEMSSILADQ